MTIFDTPGPKPGSNRVVKQHHYLASGGVLPETKRCVKTNQPTTTTGSTMAPGLTGKK